MAAKIVQAHLRVRLPEKDKAFLGALSSKSGAKPNISRAVKQLIERERMRSSMIEILPETRPKIERLSETLMRSSAKVIDESIDAVASLMEDDALPLIIQELRLYKKYVLRRHKKSNKR